MLGLTTRIICYMKLASTVYMYLYYTFSTYTTVINGKDDTSIKSMSGVCLEG